MNVQRRKSPIQKAKLIDLSNVANNLIKQWHSGSYTAPGRMFKFSIVSIEIEKMRKEILSLDHLPAVGEKTFSNSMFVDYLQEAENELEILTGQLKTIKGGLQNPSRQS